MSRDDDYLWDPRGKADPEIEKLERSLRSVPGPPPPPAWPARAPRRRLAWPVVAWPVAAAAVATLAVLGAWTLAHRDAWTVRALEGRPRVTGWAGVFTRLGAGGEVITRNAERARVAVRDIGWVELEPHSRLRLVHTGPGRDRLALARGEMHAVIVAPPRTFVVDTPSGVATDLGCAYRLRVETGGEGWLRVTAGWVAFTHAGRESFVPAGAMCRTGPGRGPGTPRFDDAPESFAEALDRLDESGGVDREALDRVLASARVRDALTLWHLIARVPRESRVRVVERLDSLVPRPASAGLEDVLALDRDAMDAWWDALGFGTSTFWRRWKGDFPGAPVAAEGGERRG